ncbi:DUF1611 domain-containing protein [Salmonella enterica subsp. enterica serovar Sandiego]|nr:DUF1611 domain-containing protein [Salmonella enterica subsp. enterica serovar Sandiego]
MKAEPRSILIYFDGHYDIYRGKFINAMIKYLPDNVKGILCYSPEDSLIDFCSSHTLPLYQSTTDVREDVTELLIGLLDFHINPENISRFQKLAKYCCHKNIKLVNGTFNFLSELFPQYEKNIVDLRKNTHIHRPIYMSNRLKKKKDQLRILTCGMDSNIGKMTASLEVERHLVARGYDVSFFPTGQIGMYLKGYGFCVDATIVDFTRGIIDEEISKINSDILIIEGQGSINHPEFFGAALSLLYGSQPQRLLFCGNFAFNHIRTNPDILLPDLQQMIARIESTSYDYGHHAKVKAISMITQGLETDDAIKKLEALEHKTLLPVDDIVRFESEKIALSLIN